MAARAGLSRLGKINQKLVLVHERDGVDVDAMRDHLRPSVPESRSRQKRGDATKVAFAEFRTAFESHARESERPRRRWWERNGDVEADAGFALFARARADTRDAARRALVRSGVGGRLAWLSSRACAEYTLRAVSRAEERAGEDTDELFGTPQGRRELAALAAAYAERAAGGAAAAADAAPDAERAEETLSSAAEAAAEGAGRPAAEDPLAGHFALHARGDDPALGIDAMEVPFVLDDLFGEAKAAKLTGLVGYPFDAEPLATDEPVSVEYLADWIEGAVERYNHGRSGWAVVGRTVAFARKAVPAGQAAARVLLARRAREEARATVRLEILEAARPWLLMLAA